RRDLDFVAFRPAHAGERRIGADFLYPFARQRRDGRSPPADQEPSPPRRSTDRLRNDRDAVIPAVEQAQQPHEVRLRLDGHDPRIETAPAANAVPDMRADVEA